MKNFLCFLVLCVVFCCAGWGQDKVVVGIEANGPDDATQMAFEWRKVNIYEKMYKDKGFKVVLVDRATQNRVFWELGNNNVVTHVTGCGHGAEWVYTGYAGEQIFSSNDSPSLMRLGGKHAHVHLLSCQTAARLGMDIMRFGSKSYAGYEENFTFTTDSAGIFFAADGAVDQVFVAGKSAREGYAEIIAKFNELIAVLQSQEPDAVKYLVGDRDCLVCLPRERETVESLLPLGVVTRAICAQSLDTQEPLTLAQYASARERGLAFDKLDEAAFQNLVVAIYQRLPREFKVGVISHGILPRDQIIKEIQMGTEIGKMFLKLEKRFMATLFASVYTTTIPVKTDTLGSFTESGRLELPCDVTVNAIQFTWQEDVANFERVLATIANKVLLDQKCENGQKYAVATQLLKGQCDYKIEGSNGPKNSVVKATLYLSLR